MTMIGLPRLVSITADPLPASLQAYSTRVTAERSIFITSPFERKDKKRETVWVENEVAEAHVVISNPMAFAIQIESIALRYDERGERQRA
jgi:hypothetical protein